MNNADIAQVFEELADLLELRGENAFRVRAYRTGAKAILQLPKQVKEILAQSPAQLQAVAGIGDTLVQKCQTLVESGKLPQLEELRASTPAVLIQMTRIPGLGAKKAMKLQQELNIQSLDELRQACEQHKVRDLAGFGIKSEQQILDGLSIASQASTRLRIDQAERLVFRLRSHLEACSAIEKLEFAGSYRRQKETVGDIDILVVSADHQSVMDQLESFPGRLSTIARGDTKMSIRVESQFQVDLRVVPAKSFGAALQYFTGSKEHNVAVRSRARKLGLSVNEYGISTIDGDAEPLYGETEEELYAKLGLRWIAPELREGRQELAWSEADGQLPDLITLDAIQGDLHMHTTASDGNNSIGQMITAARQRGLKYIAITDHSKRVSMARGLNEERLLEQWDEIDHINRTLAGSFRVLKGVECDILEAGPLDITDEVLSQADWVVASVHYGQKQSRAEITQRIVGALQNRNVDAIAHPTGRLIGSRPPYEVDMEAVIETAASERKALELNASPFRLDLNEQHLMQAVAAGVPVTINTDAHAIEQLDAIRYGIMQARRAALTKSQVLNTWSLEQLLQWCGDHAR
jgi:DNA polymerase (family X)